MKKLFLSIAIAAVLLGVGGCESKWGTAGLGAAGGAAAGVGGYEYHFSRQRDEVREAYEEGRIDKREYDIRMDQIQRDSLFQ